MKPVDEAALRRRLHEAIDVTQAGPAPVEAVFRRYRAVRARQWAALASGVAVTAVVAGVLGLPGPRVPPMIAGPAHGPARAATDRGRVFASGTVNGSRWRLAAVNLASMGSCLPGVVVNGGNGDLLQPGFLPGMALGNAAFMPADPGRPGIGFSFLWLRPGVRGLAAILGNGIRLNLRPSTVALCGQQFRLAGFEYPPQGVTRIAARSAAGHTIVYTPPAEFFQPSSPFQDGSWMNVDGAAGSAASGQIGSGSVAGISWRMQVALGTGGECFTAQLSPGSGWASICAPVAVPTNGASLTSVPYGTATGTLAWDMGTINPRTSYLRAHLSSGRTIRLTPAIVGGRKYTALEIPQGTRLTRLTLYGTHGQVLATLTSFPPGK